jgi:hypothetical protein
VKLIFVVIIGALIAVAGLTVMRMINRRPPRE